MSNEIIGAIADRATLDLSRSERSVVAERLEFGKFCREPDGSIMPGAEHGVLGYSRLFPPYLRKFCTPAHLGVRSSVNEPLWRKFPHSTVLRPVAENPERAITVFYRYWQRSESGNKNDVAREYTVARFLSAYNVDPAQLLNAMESEDLHGLTREDAGKLVEVPLPAPLLNNGDDSPIVQQSVVFLMSGVPVCFPAQMSEIEFFLLVNKIWYRLPSVLRPYLSAGWNVGQSLSGSLSIVCGPGEPQNGAVWTGDTFRDPSIMSFWNPSTSREQSFPFAKEFLIPGLLYTKDKRHSNHDFEPTVLDKPGPDSFRFPDFKELNTIYRFRREALGDKGLLQIMNWAERDGSDKDLASIFQNLDRVKYVGPLMRELQIRKRSGERVERAILALSKFPDVVESASAISNRFRYLFALERPDLPQSWHTVNECIEKEGSCLLEERDKSRLWAIFNASTQAKAKLHQTLLALQAPLYLEWAKQYPARIISAHKDASSGEDWPKFLLKNWRTNPREYLKPLSVFFDNVNQHVLEKPDDSLMLVPLGFPVPAYLQEGVCEQARERPDIVLEWPKQFSSFALTNWTRCAVSVRSNVEIWRPVTRQWPRGLQFLLLWEDAGADDRESWPREFYDYQQPWRDAVSFWCSQSPQSLTRVARFLYLWGVNASFHDTISYAIQNVNRGHIPVASSEDIATALRIAECAGKLPKPLPPKIQRPPEPFTQPLPPPIPDVAMPIAPSTTRILNMPPIAVVVRKLAKATFLSVAFFFAFLLTLALLFISAIVYLTRPPEPNLDPPVKPPGPPVIESVLPTFFLPRHQPAPEPLDLLGSQKEEPQWAPSGKTFVYSALDDDSKRQIFISKTDTTRQKLTYESKDCSKPVISLDGTRVYFLENDSWYSVSIDGGKPQLMLHDVRGLAEYPGPSIDGSEFALVEKSGLSMASVDHQRKVTIEKFFAPHGKASRIVFSPSGDQLAVLSKPKNRDNSLVLFAYPGFSRSPVTVPNEWVPEDVAWFPDGTNLAIVASNRELGRWRILKLKTDTSEATTLDERETAIRHPSVDSSGNKILFSVGGEILSLSLEH